MTDMAPHRLTYSRRYGFPLYRAPRTKDGQLVPAGLLAHGSGVFSDLPEDLEREIVSGQIRKGLAAYSCGGSLGIGARSTAPCSHFHRPSEVLVRNRHAAMKGNSPGTVNGISSGAPEAFLFERQTTQNLALDEVDSYITTPKIDPSETQASRLNLLPA